VVADWRRAGASVGLVPTMGALHAGHLSLVEAAKANCDRVITTLFVNPKQFERSDDLTGYPRGEAQDAAKLAALDVDLLFAPPLEEMYPRGFATNISVGGVTEGLCGASRPGHFDGVATVVIKLLLQSLPDRAYFGEKDYQQLQLIRRMVADLDIPVKIEGVPTVREPDGLALSSRNQLLTTDQRRIAPNLHAVLTEIGKRLSEGATAHELEAGRKALRDAGFDPVDYLALCDADTLAPVDRVARPSRLLAAAYLGSVRLIDNIPLVPT
jgi:pantoate--beta-alanine ligase